MRTPTGDRNEPRRLLSPETGGAYGQGWRTGHAAGYDAGHHDGYARGYARGLRDGLERAPHTDRPARVHRPDEGGEE